MVVLSGSSLPLDETCRSEGSSVWMESLAGRVQQKDDILRKRENTPLVRLKKRTALARVNCRRSTVFFELVNMRVHFNNL